jgi:hypothetical protein
MANERQSAARRQPPSVVAPPSDPENRLDGAFDRVGIEFDTPVVEEGRAGTHVQRPSDEAVLTTCCPGNWIPSAHSRRPDLRVRNGRLR